MATYAELHEMKNDSLLRNKITAAVAIAAEAVRVEDGGTVNHANRLIWAQTAMEDPVRESTRMMWALLAANKDLTKTAIEQAGDAAIQSNVDAVVDLFATGS